MSDETCESCRWWNGQPGAPKGDCRLNPPTVVMMPARSYTADFGVRNDVAGTKSEWVETRRGDWCGQWRDRE